VVADPDDLFGVPESATPPEPEVNRPLSDRLRPATLTEAVGQDHLISLS
jgi:putative ATPase